MGSRSRARSSARPSVLSFGDAACLVRFGATIAPRVHARVLAALAALDAAPPMGMRDVTPAYASLLVQFDPLVTSADEMAAALLATVTGAQAARRARHRRVTIPVVYGGEDGPDLDEVARLTGLPPDEVVTLHASARYHVYFLGFLAGFPYLGGLPPALAVPRLATPHAQVPAGSVAIAEAQAGIYPVASPGGWRIIGRTGVRLFDPAATPPALLSPGDEVRFVPASEDCAALCPDRQEGEHATTSAGAAAQRAEGAPWLRVLRAGPCTTVQDRGRWGAARYGVGVAGAADPEALRLGNLLLGNEPDAAGLEITLGNCAFEVAADCTVALTGADCRARCDGAPVSHSAAVRLCTGQTLELDVAADGLRAYVCVAGGVAVPRVLGSRGTDLRAGLGGLDGRALRAGDVVRTYTPSAPVALRTAAISSRQVLPAAEGVRSVRVLPGPRAAEAPAEFDALLANDYAVDPLSDRMGLRLRAAASGTGSATKPAGGQILSEGVPRGAVQVPPGGEPIVLLAEAQTTGGYAVPAVVITADLAALGQLRPGERVRFVAVTPEEAYTALCERERRLRDLVAVGGRGATDEAALARGFAEWSEAADPVR